MRIDGWDISSFGPISNWSMSGLAANDIVVILGPNESGKSALFEFFASALFGFAPATANRHPYQPWDGRSLEGRLDVVLHDGDQAQLARGLKSQPKGRITYNGRGHELANRRVAWVGLMDRDVFKNVYALTQEEALGLGKQGWQVVQDLLGGSSFDFLKPSREVFEALDSDRRRLWRPDRRGRPAHRELADEIRRLRGSLTEAQEQRHRIEEANGRLHEIAAELDGNTRELQRIELALERDRTLAPLVQRANRVRSLEAQAADLADGGDVLEGVADQREELRKRLEELRARLQEAQQGIAVRERTREIDAATRRLLDVRAEVERLDRELPRAQDHLDRVGSMDAELLRNEGALRELAERTLTSHQLDEGAIAAVLDLSVVELRGRFDAWLKSRQRLHAARDHLERLQATQEETRQLLAEHEADQEIEQVARVLLAAREDIERLDRETTRAHDHQDRLNSMDAELQRSEGALREIAGRTLTSDQVDEAARAAVLSLSVVELRGRFKSWWDARQQLQTVNDRRQQLRLQQRETRQAIEEHKAALAIEESTRRLLDARADIERLDREASRAQENKDRLGSADAEMQRTDDVLRELAGRTLTSDHIDESVRRAILDLSLAELRGRFTSWREARQQRAAAAAGMAAARSERVRHERALEAMPAEHSRVKFDEHLRELRRIERVHAHPRVSAGLLRASSLATLIALGIAGVLALVLGLVAGLHIGVLVAMAVMVVLVVAGVVIVARRLESRRSDSSDSDWQVQVRRLGLDPAADLDAEIERAQSGRDSALRREAAVEQVEQARDAEAEARRQLLDREESVETARDEFQAVIAEVPIAPIQWESPDEGLVRDLEEIRRTLHSAQRVRRDRDEVAARLDVWRTAVEALGHALHTEVLGDPFEVILAARRALLDALEVGRAAERTAGEVRRLRQQFEQGGRDLEAAEAESRRVEALTRTARDQFQAVIADIPVAPVQLETSDEGLIRDLENMRQTVDSLQRLRRNRSEVAVRLTAWREAVAKLRQTLQVELPADPLEAAPAAARALREALEAERVAQAAEARIPAVRQQLVSGQEDVGAAAAELRQIKSALQSAHEEFLMVIADIPVSPLQRETPDEGLVRDLEDMRQTVRSVQRLRDNRREVSAQLDDWRGAVAKLRQTLQIELPDDPFYAAPAARRALLDALEVERKAKAADSEIPELRQQVNASREELDTAEFELEQLDASLAVLDPEGANPEVGLERLQRAGELRTEAGRVQIEIEREFPEWRRRLSEAEQLAADGVDVGLSDAERVENRRLAEELRQTGEDLAEERGRITTRRDEWMAEPGPAHIIGAIAAAEERLQAVKRAHDRLSVLRAVVKLAEDSYRERYQSPLLSAAGRHMRHFTNGRYDLLTVDDVSSGEVKLQVRRTGENFPQNVETPLSRGTIQQIYFALRLAMVDLVEGDEPLPLFLDEMFVNWDPGPYHQRVGGFGGYARRPAGLPVHGRPLLGRTRDPGRASPHRAYASGLI